MSNPPETQPPARPLRGWSKLDHATVSADGHDAVRFVDNFVTASVGSVAVGGGTEAFVTDARGHVIALVTILRTEAGLEIVAAPGLGERLREHLEHFHIREAMELTDTTDTTACLLLAGPGAGLVATSLARAPEALPATCLDHAVTTIAGRAVRVVRVTGQGADGFWIRGERAAIAAVTDALRDAGVPEASQHDLEADRIADGYPSAIDIVEKTLPQELGRDARAISFTKGCYLGQETVARLDALGHVNRRLAILAIESESPPSCPASIQCGSDTVGTLTSSCFDANRRTTVGLAIVHTKALRAAELTIGGAVARVLAIPPARLESP